MNSGQNTDWKPLGGTLGASGCNVCVTMFVKGFGSHRTAVSVEMCFVATFAKVHCIL